MQRSGELTIYRNLFLEREELDRYFGFNQNDLSQLLFTINAQSFGVVNTAPNLAFNNSFRIEAGTNAGTIKIAEDSYAVNRLGQLIFKSAIDNIPIVNVDGESLTDQWLWVRIEHQFDKYEEGVVSVDANGNLSGINTKFTEVLRGVGAGFPVYIKLFTENSDGTLSPAGNEQLYELNSVISDTEAILSGDFIVEGNLRYVVFGTFALNQSSDAINSGGIYNYNGAKISFINEVFIDYPPINFLESGMQFFVARIFYDSTTNTVSVQDKRVFTSNNPTTGVAETFNYYYQLNFGDILVNTKAELDASNIPTGFRNNWQTALDVPSNGDLNDGLAGKANNNGTDITNPQTWLSNIGAAPSSALAAKANANATGLTPSDIQAWKDELDVPVDQEDSGWLNCTNLGSFSGFTVRARQIGKIVNIIGELTGSLGDNQQLFRVPSSIGECPYQSGYCAWADNHGDSNRSVNIRRNSSNGRQWEVWDGDVTRTIYINLTYFTD